MKSSKDNIDLFRFRYNNIMPKVGKVLLSEPFLSDVYFKRSVVLITEHSKEGTVGFVLNKSVDLDLNEALVDLPDINAPVFLGGPVSTNSIHYLHTYPNVPDSVEVLKGIYWGGRYDRIRDIVLKHGYNSRKIKFFLGYSGWSEGQLENELTENCWIVSDINPELILNTGKRDIWQETLSSLGGHFEAWANSPSNPSLN